MLTEDKWRLIDLRRQKEEEEAMKRNEQLKREQLKKSSPPTSPRGGQKPFEKTIDIKEKIGLELKHFDRSSLRKSGRDIAAGGA